MSARSNPPDSDSLVFEYDFEQPPEKVWRALTEPQLLEAWLANDPQADSAQEEAAPRQRLQAPGPVTSSDRVDGSVSQASSSEYEIVTAEPHHLLRYRCRDRESGVGDSGGREVHSVVTVELSPGPTGGTHLRLTHGEFRIVGAIPSTAAAHVTPITGARRRRTPILSCAAQPLLRRAA